MNRARVAQFTVALTLLTIPQPSRVTAAAHSDRCTHHCSIPATEIQAELDAAVAAGVPGAVLLVRSGDQVVTFTAGVADRSTGRAIRPDDRFRIASITKSFVATLVVRLAQDHRLRLDDPVVRYLPEYALDAGITIRQLLQHTSGLFDIADDNAWIETVLADPTRAWTPDELIRIGLAHPSYFAPGSGYHYSNTGYMLLGALVQRVTGHDIAYELRKRIFGPLGLGHTYVSHEATLRGHFARGYSMSADGTVIDATTLNATFTGAAGDIISTVGDVASFYLGLLRGRIVSGRYLDEMEAFLDLDPQPEDGVGLGLFRFPEACGTRTVGHTGGIFGYQSEARSSLDASVQNIVYVNTDAIPEAAYPHLGAAEQLAICGTPTG